MRVVVTGGAGFIGANLVPELLQRGAQVVVVDDLSSGKIENLSGLNCEFVEGSILDIDLNPLVQSAEAVIHLAAQTSVPHSVIDPIASHDINVNGTLRVLEAARSNCAHVVLASSSAVYGPGPTLPKVETMRPEPVSPYAVSKLAAEAYGLTYQQNFQVPMLAFRFFNIFGPKQAPDHPYAAVIPAFLYAAMHGRPLEIHDDGLQTRDFVYVGTVVDVLCDAIERRVTSASPVNLAIGHYLSLLDVISAIEIEIGHPVQREHVAARPGDVRNSQADTAEFQKLFPQVESLSFAHGLQRTWAWLQEYESRKFGHKQ